MTTMQEVADRAGVSIATVSYVVNGTKPVAPALAPRIEAAMVELKFQRNRSRSSTRQQAHSQSALAFPALERRLGATSVDIPGPALPGPPTSATTPDAVAGQQQRR